MKKILTITSLVAAMSMSVFAAQPTQTHVNQAFVQEATQTKANAPVDHPTVAPAKVAKTTETAVHIPVASAPAKATKTTAPAAPKAATSATREDAETMDTAHAMNLPNADEVRVVKHDTGLAVKDVEDATTVNKAQAPKEELAKKATSANKVTK